MTFAVTFVRNRDGDAGIQERELAKPLRQCLEAELDRLEDRGVGLERDFRAALLGPPGDEQRGRGNPTLVSLLVHLPVPPDLELEPLGQRVDDRHADAVEPARYLVGRVLEFAAGVENRQHDFGGRLAAFVQIHGNPAAIVHDRQRPVDVNRHLDVPAVPGEGFVDRVVDDFVEEMMEAGRTGGPDVHRRPLLDGFEPFKNLDFVCAVVVGTGRCTNAYSGARPGLIVRLAVRHFGCFRSSSA